MFPPWRSVWSEKHAFYYLKPTIYYYDCYHFLVSFFHFDRPHHISLTHWLDILHSLFFVGHLLFVLKVVSIYLIHWKLWLKPIITSSLLVCWQGDGRPFWKLVVSEATGSTNNDYFEEVYKVTFHDSSLKLS